MIQLLRSSLATEIIRVSGVFSSKALSSAVKNKISLKNVKIISPVCFEAQIFSCDEERIKRVLKDNYKVEIISKNGFLYNLKRLIKRYALLAGIVLSVIALFVLSKRVMFIKVFGSDDAKIIQAVKSAQLTSWHFKAKDNVASAVDSIMQIEGVIWANIEIKGVYANVFVEQEQMLDFGQKSGKIVAKSDGVIKNLIVYSGTPLVKNGDTVFAGQVLVEDYEMRGQEQVFTEAKAKVITQTWYLQSETIPCTNQKNVLTGNQKAKTEISLFGKSFTFENGKPFKEAIEDKKEIFTSFLPIKITKINLREYKKQIVKVDEEKAIRQAEIDLSQKIMLNLAKNAVIIEKNVDVQKNDDFITVSVCYAVLEDIAKYQ